jgi:ATP-dependent RNA helicase DeaD
VENINSFKELGLSESTLEAIGKKGYEIPSPIQALCIPKLLGGDNDVIGQAQTGTGKTAAFSLPIIDRISRGKNVQAIILAPTRELVIQVADEIISLKGDKDLRILPIYGGTNIQHQMKKLKDGIDIVVGTPGRVQDLLDRKKLRIDKIKYFILDEADEMLNMGFLEDIEKILEFTNDDKKMLFFSATMPKEIMTVAKSYMKNYEVLAVKSREVTTDLTEQIYFEVRKNDKFEALSRVIDIEKDFYGIIFCQTKVDVNEVTGKLIERGYDADCIHGEISQNQREKVLSKFKKGQINILVATDVAARGIDVNNLTHVINYSLPQDPESYIHRIGRTGRAGNQGTAITFVTPNEYRKLSFIQKVARTEIKKEKLPKIKDILKHKEEAFIESVNQNLEVENYESYMELAKKLLNDRENVEEMLAALLKHALGDELEIETYNEIVEGRNDSRNKERNRNRKDDFHDEKLDSSTRLFIAKGALDGMNIGKLVGLICAKSKVKRKLIRNVQIFEKFSFVSVPFNEAETIIKSFRTEKVNSGKQSLVEVAKKKR